MQFVKLLLMTFLLNGLYNKDFMNGVCILYYANHSCEEHAMSGLKVIDSNGVYV